MNQLKYSLNISKKNIKIEFSDILQTFSNHKYHFDMQLNKSKIPSCATNANVKSVAYKLYVRFHDQKRAQK